MDVITSDGRFDIVRWVEAALPAAIKFADAEQLRVDMARKYHIERTIERGTCPVGHTLDPDNIPINSLGTAQCGYCTNAAEHISASADA